MQTKPDFDPNAQPQVAGQAPTIIGQTQTREMVQHDMGLNTRSGWTEGEMLQAKGFWEEGYTAEALAKFYNVQLFCVQSHFEKWEREKVEGSQRQAEALQELKNLAAETSQPPATPAPKVRATKAK